MDSQATRIAFIGGGNMARSLIAGLLANGTSADMLGVAEPEAEARGALAREYGLASYASNLDAAQASGLWILAVKPQVMRAVCMELAPLATRQRPLVVSIAAGIRCRSLRAWLGTGPRLVRSMPNTPALLRAGVTALYPEPDVTEQELARCMGLFRSVGAVVRVNDESLMDAVTAVSGSGPAYFFALIEAMEAAAVAQGLSPEAAATLVRSTAAGAARMVTESAESPATLRERVTSPGGTTAAGLAALREHDFAAAVSAAVAAATARGRVLSTDFGS
ncbi:MAG: pyrroline-5-carboxylate reductase [Xanthomonadales bacterium]|jgi:pyrroline-5-carboxylate reductase|nr:pyrroline-5-carboxylate reductase [Xanthomonadales bacterium]